MKKITLLLGMVLIGTFVFAKGGDNPVESNKNNVCILKGQVIDKLNGESLTGVAVRIKGSEQITYTDFDGEFSFSNLLPGTYTLETSLVSYEETKLVVEAETASSGDLAIQLETISEK